MFFWDREFHLLRIIKRFLNPFFLERIMDNKMIPLFLNVLLKELKKSEFKSEVLKPILKSMMWYMMPYVFLIVCINLFFMIMAMSIVFYFMKR